LLSVYVSADGVRIESPVPVVVEVAGRPAQTFAAGQHTVSAS
jgi:hypothetical protein